MKGKDLIKIIQRHQLEEYEIEVSFIDGYSTFPNIRRFKIDDLDDIGHSDSVAIIGIDEIS